LKLYVTVSTYASLWAVLFPFIYLVSAWFTILAPYFMGFNRAGLGTVLSTIKGILAAFASLPMASRSSTSNCGFPKDSTQMALVFSFMAFLKLAGSSASTKVVVIPTRGRVTLNKL